MRDKIIKISLVAVGVLLLCPSAHAISLCARDYWSRALAIQEILTKKWNEAKERQVAWEDFLKTWEADFRRRAGNKNELLALMAAKSPTFELQLMDFLWKKKGGIKVRAPKPSEDLSWMIAKVAAQMFRKANPEPGWRRAWLKSFAQTILDRDKLRNMPANFAALIQDKYREPYKKLLTSVTTESYGVPRPDVVRDFYTFGLTDAIYRRLAAVRFLASKGPKEYGDLLYDAEVERLSLEIQWFARPIIGKLIAYYTLWAPAYEAYQDHKEVKKVEEDVKKNPEKYLGYKKADDDRLQSLNEQLDDLHAEKRELENALAQNPPDATEKRRHLEKVDRKITKIDNMLKELEKGFAPPTPSN
jgi:hypothetical protein